MLADEPEADTNEEENLFAFLNQQKESENDKVKLNKDDSNDREIEYLNEIMNPEEGMCISDIIYSRKARRRKF
jgi:hypothetical protein